MSIINQNDNYGADSIKLNGVPISRLPIAEQVNAAAQIPLARDDELKNQIAAVLARYPTQSSASISARIKEAKDNIIRISTMRQSQLDLINNFTNIKNMCRVRDKELTLYEGQERKDKIREWNKNLANANTDAYIVYQDMDAFDKQIEQSQENIARAEDVIERERDDISGMEKLTGQIVARDIELRRLGVVKDK